jgi:hypothetical protein
MATGLPFGRLTAASGRGAAALRTITSRLSFDRIINGGWFRKLAVEHIRRHDARSAAAATDGRGTTEQRAESLIGRAALKASAAGGLASAGASTGELVALLTEGIGAPVGLPAVALSMAGEAAYTAFLQIDLACDLAALYGVPFDVDDLGDLTTLFALALELPPDRAVPPPQTPRSESGLFARLVQLEDGEVGKRIGRKLLEDSLIKNVVPIVGIAISARWNHAATKRLGATVLRYVRYRRALRDTLAGLHLDTLAEPELLVEGAWLLATMDGPDANAETTMAIGLVLEAMPESVRRDIGRDRAFGDDEEGWFDALAVVPPNMHCPLVDVLCLVAAADRELKPSERRFLHRVGRALRHEVDLARVEAICRHLGDGVAIDHATAPHAHA